MRLRRAGVSDGSPVPGWIPAGALHPRLTLRVGAPAAETLDVLAGSLRRARFRVDGRTAVGLWATNVNWLALFVSDVERTVLQIVVAPASATDLVVTVSSGAEHRSGEKRAAHGLSAGVAELRRRGHSVVVDGWEPA